MKTIITFKIVWIDDYGDMCEKDFSRLEDARNYIASNNIDAKIYEVRLLGEMKEVQ